MTAASTSTGRRQGLRLLHRPIAGSIVLAAVAAAFSPLGAPVRQRDWTQPNGGLGGDAGRCRTPISSSTVGGLSVRWRFRLPRLAVRVVRIDAAHRRRDGVPPGSGLVRLRRGRPHRALRWVRRERAPNDGPNGLALAGGRALRRDRHERFRTRSPDGKSALGTPAVKPVRAVHGHRPPGRPRPRLRLDRRLRPRRPRCALRARPGDGEDPLALRDHPRAMASPLGGRRRRLVSRRRSRPTAACTSGTRTRARGEGAPRFRTAASTPGRRPTPMRSSPWRRTGKLLWYDQVTQHDVRDYDLEASPILVGKTRVRRRQGREGRRLGPDQGRRLWSKAVGTHLHDLGPLPRRPTLVCPGLWGGVLTPMSYAGGRLFVPVVERCMRESATHPGVLPDASRATASSYALSARRGRGSGAAGSARRRWDARRLPVTWSSRLHTMASGGALGDRRKHALARHVTRAGIISARALPATSSWSGPAPRSRGGRAAEVVAYALFGGHP